MSFGCERSCSSARRVSNCNSKVPQGGVGGGIYPHVKFERHPLNVFRVRALTSSWSTVGGGVRGGDDKIISPNTSPNPSPNTSFGDIIMIMSCVGH